MYFERKRGEGKCSSAKMFQRGCNKIEALVDPCREKLESTTCRTTQGCAPLSRPNPASTRDFAGRRPSPPYIWNRVITRPSIDLVKSKVIPRISMEMSQTSSFTCLTNPLHHFENDSSLGIIISFFDGIRAYRSISV